MIIGSLLLGTHGFGTTVDQHDIIRAKQGGNMKPSYIYKAHVDRVVDGDTSDVTVDLGSGSPPIRGLDYEE